MQQYMHFEWEQLLEHIQNKQTPDANVWMGTGAQPCSWNSHQFSIN